ncbi:MAG: DUF4255 domain-containing protein, partial [Acidimicrobiales bacterium]
MPERLHGGGWAGGGRAGIVATVIHDVDESLRRLLRRDALNGSDVEVAFDAPTKEWAASRNTPSVDVYLYDIRENLRRREVMYEEVRDDDGRVLVRRPPPRRFDLSYLLTAWTQRPEDEHRLLAACLGCFLRYEVLPQDLLAGALADQEWPAHVHIALPPAEDRNMSDVWSALGGELKPSLDLVTTVAIDSRGLEPVAPLVTEAPIIGIRGANGAQERVSAPGRSGKGAAAASNGEEDTRTAAEKVAA